MAYVLYAAVLAVVGAAFASDPTVQSALIAAVASVTNTAILIRHERRVNRRFDERRNVIVKGTPEDPEAVLVTAEERRALEDRRAVEAKRRRNRRRGERRSP